MVEGRISSWLWGLCWDNKYLVSGLGTFTRWGNCCHLCIQTYPALTQKANFCCLLFHIFLFSDLNNRAIIRKQSITCNFILLPVIYTIYSLKTFLHLYIFLKRFYLFILERGGGREKDRERNIDVRETHQCTRAWTSRKPGVCRDKEPNQWPFPLWGNAQPVGMCYITEIHIRGNHKSFQSL